MNLKISAKALSASIRAPFFIHSTFAMNVRHADKSIPEMEGDIAFVRHENNGEVDYAQYFNNKLVELPLLELVIKEGKLTSAFLVFQEPGDGKAPINRHLFPVFSSATEKCRPFDVLLTYRFSINKEIIFAEFYCLSEKSTNEVIYFQTVRLSLAGKDTLTPDNINIILSPLCQKA